MERFFALLTEKHLRRGAFTSVCHLEKSLRRYAGRLPGGRDPATGKLRFIEVKGRVADADSITVTRNEVLTALNKPEDFILAIVRFGEDGGHAVRYVREPFAREPDFGAVSVTYAGGALEAGRRAGVSSGAGRGTGEAPG